MRVYGEAVADRLDCLALGFQIGGLRWKAMRWAVRRPTPGKHRSVRKISSRSGEKAIAKVCSSEWQLHPGGQIQTGGHTGHFVLSSFFNLT